MNELATQSAKPPRNRYYGKYRGFVFDNEDKQHLGRVRLLIPSVLGDQPSGWALPCFPFGGLAGQGWFTVPSQNAQVWVEFEEGNVNIPIWTGTFWQKADDVPVDTSRPKPTMCVLQTASGHRLEFDDAEKTKGIILQHAAGAQIVVDAQGSITITDQQGAKLVLDAAAKKVRVEDVHTNALTMDSAGVSVTDRHGNVVETSAQGVTVKGKQVIVEGTQVSLGGVGGEPVIKGPSFLTLFATHVHPTTTPGGPTLPPIPQGEASSLSAVVTAK